MRHWRQARFLFWVLLTCPTVAWAGDTGDPGLHAEVHRERLQSEFQLLEEARATSLGSSVGIQGTWFTVRRTLFSWETDQWQETASSTGGVRRAHRVLPPAPPLRLTLGGEGATVHGQLGAIDVTLGHGSLVQRYLNNPRPEAGLGVLGLVAGTELGAGGAELALGNVVEPGRLVGVNVHGRPALWVGGTVANLMPQVGTGWDLWTLVLRSLNVGVSGAVDSDVAAAARTLGEDFRHGRWRFPSPQPGTAGGMALEADAGLNHRFLTLRGMADLTSLARTFRDTPAGEASPRTQHLLGAGFSSGVDMNLSLWIVNAGVTARYGLYGPNYLPSYFNQDYEADRLDTGTGPKISRRAPARQGYQLQLGGQVLRTLGAFAELQDARPLDPRLQGNAATLRVGALLHLLRVVSVMGAYVNRDFQDYARALAPGKGSLWLSEVRVQVLLLALVARSWRSYQVEDGVLHARDGASVVGELQFGL